MKANGVGASLSQQSWVPPSTAGSFSRRPAPGGLTTTILAKSDLRQISICAGAER